MSLHQHHHHHHQQQHLYCSHKSPAWSPDLHNNQESEYPPIDFHIIAGSVVNVKTLHPLLVWWLCQISHQPGWELNEPCSTLGTETCFSMYAAGGWSAFPWYRQVCPEGGPETLGSSSITSMVAQTRGHITGLTLIWSNLLQASSLAWMNSLKVELLPRKRPRHIKSEVCAGSRGNGWAV